MKFKILHITLRADIGGGPRYIDLLINNIDETRFKSFLFCPKDEPYWSEWSSNDKVKGIIEVPHRKFSFKYFKLIKSFIKKNEIDIIHSSGKGAGLYSRMLKLFFPNVKIVHTFHGIHIDKYNFFVKMIYLYYEKLMKIKTDFFINVSKGEHKQCLNYNIIDYKKTAIIYNGANLIASTNLERREDFRIITVTRFDYQKNMDLAYRIAKTLKKETRIKFYWIGDGDDKIRLEQKAIEEKVTNINFMGFIKPNKIKELLVNSDIYLTTSRWEGLPFSLVEATASGLPIIASNVIGNNEVVIHNYNGYIFNINEVDAAQKQILKLYEDKQKIKEMRQKSLLVFSENFTVEAMIKSHQKVYESIVTND